MPCEFNTRLVTFDEVFLDLSWIWLNDPEIKQMTGTPDFTRESQQIWFKSLTLKTDYKIWGVHVNEVPAGACGIKNITNSDCEYWGYIGEKNLWGHGIGFKLLTLMEMNAREIGKSTIWLRVTKQNVKAIQLYLRNDYNTESETDNELIMRKIL
ncbi:MAG: GNAT family N-acetyltransferase [Bacteroidales bacterium]